MANRQQMRTNIRRQKQTTTKEKYIQAQQRYLAGQFTYDSHCLIQNLTEKGKQQPYMEGVQLYKILIEIAKILMLNQLQILFLGATLEQMKWKVIDICLNNYIEDFKGIKQGMKSDNYNKKVQLSLLLIGYVVKVYLNQSDETGAYQVKIRQLIQKDYDKMYQEWVQRMKKNFKFSPKNMNKLFRQMDIIKTKKQGELDDVNYNSKVQQLFKNYIEPDVKNQYTMKEPRLPEPLEEIEQEDEMPQVPYISSIARAQSIQSIRSLGRRDSERSQKQGRQFGIFKLNSLQDL